MLTVDSLLTAAVVHDLLGERRQCDEALTAAQWMEDMRLTEVKQIGDLGGKKLVKGQRVRIKKGRVIRSMHPRHTRDNPKIAGRDYTITVHSVYGGYIDTAWHLHRAHQAVRNSEVVWPGEGGYWCHVDTSEVEIVA